MSVTLEPVPGESGKCLQALKDYIALGPGRSLEKLAEMYRTSAGPAPPTRHLRTLKEWSSRYNWQVRAQRWDFDDAQTDLSFFSERMADERRKWRERRLKLLEAQFGNVARMMKHLNGERGRDAIECSVSELDRAIRTLLSESRAELSDKPTPGLQLVGPDGHPVISMGSIKKAVREMSDIVQRNIDEEQFERIQDQWRSVKIQ